MSTVQLTSAKYGKEKVRVFRVVRAAEWHEVVEYTVSVLLEGEIQSSYTQANNAVVVATDSMKNTVNVFAKTSPHVLVPELFALHLGLHFVATYKHITQASITVISHRWTRIPISNKPHPHAFSRDGNDVVQIEAVVRKVKEDSFSATLVSGLKDLLVLKTKGSGFENFIRDDWTTLPEVSDRILSTSIECRYTIDLPSATPLEVENLSKLGINFGSLAKSVREITLETFALDESASVQATLYKMAESIIGTNPSISSVFYSLPNKHYLPIDLSWYQSIQNTRVQDAEVFVPVEAPSGLITATVSRTGLGSSSS
ncbi:hypothetical protein CROQUDRAFT_63994 [Cronartium quercuum f. sp. fusiforme G11]|uniref:Uricase n=1 Tax=Cronartium quercuum f. sp. fusiforme G11 TaxID=708437 RepID=A0A9P6NKT6_9BASI|nr:hypothetical protein CROQUDRAFT_63994 [Cronartium quercuum f. sp. fusiforme G11]